MRREAALKTCLSFVPLPLLWPPAAPQLPPPQLPLLRLLFRLQACVVLRRR